MNENLTPQDNRRKPFSRREWLFAIALLLMLEAWILNLSYTFQSDQAVINYISFASTIASLLLAVIAIIYGYYQSDTAQKSGAIVEAQLTRMQSSQVALETMTRDLNGQLSSISAATNLLDAIRDSIEGTQSKLGALEGGLSGLRQSHTELQASLAAEKASTRSQEVESNSGTDPKVAILRAVFRQTSFTADIAGFALWHAVNQFGKLKIPLWQFLKKFVVEPLKGSGQFTYATNAWSELTLQALMILSATEVIKVKIDPQADLSSIEIDETIFSALALMAKQTAKSATTGEATRLIEKVKW